MATGYHPIRQNILTFFKSHWFGYERNVVDFAEEHHSSRRLRKEIVVDFQTHDAKVKSDPVKLAGETEEAYTTAGRTLSLLTFL